MSRLEDIRAWINEIKAMDNTILFGDALEKHYDLLDTDPEYRRKWDEMQTMLDPDPNFDEPEPKIDPDSDDLDDLFAWFEWLHKKRGITREYTDAAIELAKSVTAKGGSK